MNKLVGKLSGCFDIAPYETKYASDPRRRAIDVVAGPETQFRARRIGYEGVSIRTRSTVTRRTFPPVHPFAVTRNDLSARSS
jgi:hypothetical protein